MVNIFKIPIADVDNVASNTIAGRATSGTGALEDLSPAEARLILDVYTTTEVDNAINAVDLSGYVPYTGAMSDLDLGAFELSSSHVTVDGPNTNQSKVITLKKNGIERGSIYSSYDNVALQPAIVLGSALMQGAVNGHVAIGTTGTTGMVGITNGLGLAVGGSYYLGFGSTSSAVRDQSSGWADVRMYRDGAHRLALQYGTNAQSLLVSKTYTSTTSREYQRIGYDATSGLYDVGVDYVGTAGGTNYGKRIGSVNSAGVFAGLTVGTTGSITLPAGDYFTPAIVFSGSVSIEASSNSFNLTASGQTVFTSSANKVSIRSSALYGITGGSSSTNTVDIAWGRASSGVFEINSGALGALRDLSCRDITASTGTFSGIVTAGASTTSAASINIPDGVAPTSPVDGDIWHESDTLKFRDSSTTRTLATTDDVSSGYVPYIGATADLDLGANVVYSTGGFAASNHAKLNGGQSAQLMRGGQGYLGVMAGNDIRMPSGTTLSWVSDPTNLSSTKDVILGRDGAGALGLRNSTNAQQFGVYNTYISTTSFESLRIKANTGAAYQIGSAIGSAGGTNRDLEFGHWDSAGTFTADVALSNGVASPSVLVNGRSGSTQPLQRWLATGQTAGVKDTIVEASGSLYWGPNQYTRIRQSLELDALSSGLNNIQAVNWSVAQPRGFSLSYHDNAATRARLNFIVENVSNGYGKITPRNGSGANNAGSELRLCGGAGTGTGVGGPVRLQVATASGVSSSTANTLEDALVVGQDKSVTLSGTTFHAASTTSTASLNIPAGVAPTAPILGDIWHESDSLKFRDSTQTQTLATLSDLSSGYVPYTGATAGLNLGAYGLSASTGTFSGDVSSSTQIFRGNSLIPISGDSSYLYGNSGGLAARFRRNGVTWYQYSGGGHLTFHGPTGNSWDPVYVDKQFLPGGSLSIGSVTAPFTGNFSTYYSTINGTTATEILVHNTYTSTTSFETFRVKANTGAAYQIGSAIGSAGGTNRDLEFGSWNSAGTFSADLIIANNVTQIRHSSIAVTGSTAIPHTLELYNTFTSDDDIASIGFLTRIGTKNASLNYQGGGSFGANGSINLAISATSSSVSKNDTAISFTRTSCILTPKALSYGSPIHFLLTGASHTNLTASTEATDVKFNLARTVQFATGALTTQRAMRILAPTYSFVGASTITTASTFSISGCPIAGSNATIDNAYSLHIESGKVGLAASTTSASSLNIPDGVAPTTPADGDIWSNGTALIHQAASVSQTIATLNTVQAWESTQYAVVNSNTFSATFDDDTSAGSSKQKMTLSADITAFTMSNGVEGQPRIWYFLQDGTGDWTITFSGIEGTEPVIGTTAGELTVVEFEYVDGTGWRFV